jgi:hypothetical protein
MNAPRLTLSVDNDTPLRLADAIEIAFPRGGITVSGLRKEAAKGRLIIERIAGKDFVTLAAINAMRAECRIGDPKRSRPLQSARQSSRPRLVAFDREAADRRYFRAQTGVLSQSGPEAVPKPRLRLRIFR